jgi:hypothetical protein
MTRLHDVQNLQAAAGAHVRYELQRILRWSLSAWTTNLTLLS